MPGITIDTVFTNTALPVSKAWADDIVAMPNLLMWAQADASHTTDASGKVSEFVDRGGSGAKFEQTTSTRRAALESAQINGYSAATFRGTDTVASDATEFYQFDGSNLGASSEYTFAAVFKRVTSNSTDTIISRGASGTGQSSLQVELQSEVVKLVHDSSEISSAITAGEWNFAIARYDGADLMLNVNGTDATPVTASGTITDIGLYLGSLQSAGNRAFDGSISDVFVFNRSITDTEVLALVGYCDGAYSL